MARLDAFIDRLFEESGTDLTLETRAGALVRVGDTTIPLIRQPLTTPQILNAIAEVVPEDLRRGFPSEGELRFPYGAGAKRVMVVFEKRGDYVRARIVRDPQGSSVPAVRAVPSEPQARSASARTTVPVVLPYVLAPVEAGSFNVGAPREAMDRLLVGMLERRASDLHLGSGCVPSYRIDGSMRPMREMGVLRADQLQSILFSIAPEKNQEEWKSIRDTDFAYETERARYRVNLFSDRNGIGGVFRLIPRDILTAEDLGLSPAILELCKLPKGLVLVTGPTGSGKSTTLAAMVDYVNRTRDDHIVTIEDPIEFVHPNKHCLINQREVGVNTGSFKHALRAALREDPDIVLVGEMRDLETVSIALETAETGHLVFGTLHTSTAASTIDRIIDQYPADRQAQIRTMLSESLKGVIAQTLCRKISGGRVAALEVLLCSGAVSNLIREGKTFQIPSVLQTSRGAGMVTLNDALLDLVKRRVIEPEEALSKALAKAEFKMLLDRGGLGTSATPPAVARVGT